MLAAAGGDGSSGGSSGGDGGGGSGGSGGGGSEPGDDDELLSLTQAEELAAARGAALPEDMAATAASGGLRRSALDGYLAILGSGFLSSLLARMLPAFRDRLIADRLFLFKILAEVAIDSGAAPVWDGLGRAPGGVPPQAWMPHVHTSAGCYQRCRITPC